TSARPPERLAGRGRGDGTAVGGVCARLQEGGRNRGECDEEDRGDETCHRRSCASPCLRPVLRSRPQDRGERAEEDAQTKEEPDVSIELPDAGPRHDPGGVVVDDDAAARDRQVAKRAQDPLSREIPVTTILVSV